MVGRDDQREEKGNGLFNERNNVSGQQRTRKKKVARIKINEEVHDKKAREGPLRQRPKTNNINVCMIGYRNAEFRPRTGQEYSIAG